MIYDKQGALQSVSCDRIGPALLPIVRGLRDRIDSVEAQLAAA